MASEHLSRTAARGTALFLGGFSLVNLAGGIFVDGFDASLMWIGLPRWGTAGMVVLIAASCALLTFGVGLNLSPRARGAATAAVLAAAAAGVADAMSFFHLWAAGAIHPAMPVPLSLVVAGALACVAVEGRRDDAAARRRPWAIGGVAMACAALFPFAQMACFGRTDYRRPADAAVVFGALAYADGRPSDALADRVRTGCRLYADGLVDTLVFSGGPGDGAVHETESMRRMALAAGIPDRAIILDPAGVNTQATVRNTVPLLRRTDKRRVLAVSHAYHLPRVKLTYQRAGLDVYTVPAQETRTLSKMPLLMGREAVALWVYYARPLVG